MLRGDATCLIAKAEPKARQRDPTTRKQRPRKGFFPPNQVVVVMTRDLLPSNLDTSKLARTENVTLSPAATSSVPPAGESPGDICGEIALFHGGVRGAADEGAPDTPPVPLGWKAATGADERLTPPDASTTTFSSQEARHLQSNTHGPQSQPHQPQGQ